MSNLEFLVLLGVLGAESVAVVVLVVYQVRHMKQARLGALLEDACGGYVAAIRELERIHAQTDVLARDAMKAALRRPLDVTNLSSSAPAVEQPRPVAHPGIMRRAGLVCECGHGGEVHRTQYEGHPCNVQGCACERYRPK